MRIVGGRHRGRRLAAPAGEEVRPTSGLARESLFNVLTHGRFAAEGSPLAEAVVLDAFAGSGANGLEALSRGARHAIFMESQAAAISTLRQNVAALGEDGSCTVMRADVTRPPRATQTCDLVILDPPYGQGLATPGLKGLRAAGWIKPGALVVVELMKTEDMVVPEGFADLDVRRYGKAKLVFLRADAA